MAHVGEEIRRLREARGWTQPRLAVESGIAVSGISLIENGRRNPGAGTLNRLARALGVEVGDLFPKAEAPLPLSFAGAGESEQNGYVLVSDFNEALYDLERAYSPDMAPDWSRQTIEEMSATVAKAAVEAASAGLATGSFDAYVETVQVLTRATTIVRLLDERAVEAPAQTGPLPENVVKLRRTFDEWQQSAHEHEERRHAG